VVVAACPRPSCAEWTSCPPVEPAGCGCEAGFVGCDGCVVTTAVGFEAQVTEWHGDAVVSIESMVADAPAGESIAAAAPVDQPEAAVQQPTPAESLATERPAAVTSVVPDLKPAEEAPGQDVQQAVAIDEPAMEPAGRPEPSDEPQPKAEPDEPPMQLPPEETAPAESAPEPETPSDEVPAEPVPPAEPNLFEEADKELDEPAAMPPEASPSEDTPPMREPAADATPREPAVSEDSEPMPAPENEPPQPVQDPGQDPVQGPAEGEPAADAVDPPTESANPLDAAERRSGEPARLWIDATGRHSVVGVLVEMRVDGTCVLDTGAGLLEVRAADLRRRDRDYAAQAAERLASQPSPAAVDTAAR
jgi:flagellar motor protein MotB